MKLHRWTSALAASLLVLTSADRLNAQLVTVTVENTTPTLGDVVIEPDQDSYDIGSMVTFTGQPIEGYQVARWAGTFIAYGNQVSVIVEEAIDVTVSFEPIPVYLPHLIADPSGAGSISLNPPPGEGYVAGTEITITALAAPGYAFTTWGGDIIDHVTSNGITTTVNGDMNILANFDLALTLGPDADACSCDTSTPCGAAGTLSLALTFGAMLIWRLRR
jgi:hypothetical protein